MVLFALQIAQTGEEGDPDLQSAKGAYPSPQAFQEQRLIS